MFYPLTIFIGARYTKGKQKRSVSFIALTSMLGIMLGVAVMIIVLSVMNGFEREMRSRVLQLIPQITIESDYPILKPQELAQQALQHKEVTAYSFFTHAAGLFSRPNQISKVVLEGVEANFSKTSILAQFIKQGSLSDLSSGSFNLILGSKLATELGVKVGDKITFGWHLSAPKTLYCCWYLSRWYWRD